MGGSGRYDGLPAPERHFVKKSRFQHPLERRINHLWQAFLVYFFIVLFWALPLPAASAVGGWIGRTLGPRLGISRRARKHLSFVFPEKSDAEKDIILHDMWENLGRVTAEAPHVRELGRLERIDVSGEEHLQAALATKRPIMMISGHFANWEIAPIIMMALGCPIAGVYRRPNNPYVDYLIKRMRRPISPALFNKGAEGARGLMRWLREGKAVGLLVDQKMNEGVAMDFVGQPAMTGTAPAQMALMTNALILPAYVVREKGCRFRGVICPPIDLPTEGTREEKAMVITARINDFLSEHIRRYPGQWLWLHRRWIESGYRGQKV